MLLLKCRTNPDIAIAGGFVEAVIHPDVVDWERDYGFMGLIFSGLDLRASSVVIPPEVTSESDMEKIIIQVISITRNSTSHCISQVRLMSFSSDEEQAHAFRRVDDRQKKKLGIHVRMRR